MSKQMMVVKRCAGFLVKKNKKQKMFLIDNVTLFQKFPACIYGNVFNHTERIQLNSVS